MIDLSVVRLSQDILQHLLLRERGTASFLGLQDVLSILLTGFPLLLVGFDRVDSLSDVVLHLI